MEHVYSVDESFVLAPLGGHTNLFQIIKPSTVFSLLSVDVDLEILDHVTHGPLSIYQNNTQLFLFQVYRASGDSICDHITSSTIKFSDNGTTFSFRNPGYHRFSGASRFVTEIDFVIMLYNRDQLISWDYTYAITIVMNEEPLSNPVSFTPTPYVPKIENPQFSELGSLKL
jgi:hypothetical protein